MRTTILILTALLLASCGGKDTSVEEVIESGNLTEIRNKKAVLNAEQSKLAEQISKLDEAIEKLDEDTRFPLVIVQKIQDTVFNHFVEVPGDVATDQNIIIYPEYAGVLRQVLVTEGQRVSEGQVLARIDEGGLSSQLAQLEAQAALAKTTFERQQRLWKQNIGSEIQFLEAQTNFEAVQSSVDQMKSQVAKTVVRAPFSGVIDQVITDQGQVVAPGQSPLFRLLNLSELYITAAVPEAYLSKVEKGTKVQVEIPSAGTSFESEVEFVGNFINPNNRTFEVRVDVPQGAEGVKPNLIATVMLNDYSAEGAISIPETAIHRTASGEEIVYTVQAESDSLGTAQRRVIRTGANYKEKMEILSGLENGELLIVEGAKNVQEGEKVKF